MKSKKTICFCTCISASRLRSVISFLALVSVPSKSSTRSLYFISRFCLGFEGAKVVVLGISSNRMQVNSELMIRSLFDTLLNERSLHSVVCMEKQLSADTLNRIWADSLRARHIVAKTSIQIVTADSSKCIRSEGSCDNDCFVSPIWVAYVGHECEVEVAGFLSSTCWSVIRYSSFLFVQWKVVILILLVVALMNIKGAIRILLVGEMILMMIIVWQ